MLERWDAPERFTLCSALLVATAMEHDDEANLSVSGGTTLVPLPSTPGCAVTLCLVLSSMLPSPLRLGVHSPNRGLPAIRGGGDADKKVRDLPNPLLFGLPTMWRSGDATRDTVRLQLV